MTLIITAICNDGICIKSDTRTTVKAQHGESYKDDNKKVYVFKSGNIAIYNHGVNSYSGKFWRDLCNDYEHYCYVPRVSLVEVARDFKHFVKNEIKNELKNNQYDDFSAFVILGKIGNDSKYNAIEYTWQKKDPNIIKKYILKGLFLSGNGRDYLMSLKTKYHFDDNEFWIQRSIQEAKLEIQKIMTYALNEKKIKRGNEFSDKFDEFIIQ